MNVIKRNGEIVPFESEKIYYAITKAMGETELGVDLFMAGKIAEEIYHISKGRVEPLNIEEIQDLVENSLMDKKRFDVAKRYIIYRNERDRLREQGWIMSDLQRDIYQQKYKFGNEDFDGFLERVSGGNKFIKKAIRDKKFLPAGRILASRGLDTNVTLSNCYVVPKVEDSLESIFDTAKYLAKTYAYGGGSGLNLSKLRPNGATVQNSAKHTTGAVSFMDLYSLVTGLIGQNNRRGALMLNMDVNHPDIEEFIDVKNSDSERVRFANISVNVDDEFMKAVKEDKLYKLEFKVEATGEYITKLVRAKELFTKLAYNSWNSAEPAILYQDTINGWHLMSADELFEFAGINPCGEEPLPAFGSCNLSAINLADFVKYPFTDSAEFDYVGFSKMVREGVIYLNEVLDENMERHPLPQQREVSRDLRQIGLGIMGLADMFIKMGITYGSDTSIAISEIISHTMINEALQQSALLAKEHGTFPLFNQEAIFKSEFLNTVATDETLELIIHHGLRNSQILTVAPTGSTSTMLGVSGGIEPIFQLSYTRKSETLHDRDTYYKVSTPIVQEYMNIYGLANENELPDFFITSQEINYKDRIKVQGAWQQNIDASISSTVNLPEETTVEEVADLYMLAWENNLKGITVYRDGCMREGILTTNKKKPSRMDKLDELQLEMDKLIVESLEENPDQCPMCGGVMNHSGGCTECRDCGYSPCSI